MTSTIAAPGRAHLTRAAGSPLMDDVRGEIEKLAGLTITANGTRKFRNTNRITCLFWAVM